MGQTKRPRPVRADHWQPDDPILDTIIRRCVDEAESVEAGAGGSTIMGGALVLAVLGVMIMAGMHSAQGALIVPALLGAVGLAYMVAKSGPDRGPRHATLSVVGGSGRLPAGYLVHEDAWEAGMAEHVAHIPESQLQAAAQMCRLFPGTVDDLLIFTGTIAAQVPPVRNGGPADVQRRTRDLVRIGGPILREFIAKNPPTAAVSTAKRK